MYKVIKDMCRSAYGHFRDRSHNCTTCYVSQCEQNAVGGPKKDGPYISGERSAQACSLACRV